MPRIYEITTKAGANGIGSNERVIQPELAELRIRNVRELYRARKISEWFFDLVFRIVLNFGNWVTAVAFALKAGFTSFHARRQNFAEERRMRPPVYISGAEAEHRLKEIEKKVTVIMPGDGWLLT